MSVFFSRCPMRALGVFALCCQFLHYHARLKVEAVKPVSQYPNVALGKATDQGPGTHSKNQTGDLNMYKSFHAVDGDPSTDQSNCALTTSSDLVWWMVDLQTVHRIHGIAILNPKPETDQLRDLFVDVFVDDPRKAPGFPDMSFGEICAHQADTVGAGEWAQLSCEDTSSVAGRYVRVVKFGTTVGLGLCEVQVYASLVTTHETFMAMRGLKSLAEPKQDLGVFSSPAQCGVLVLQLSHLDAFIYNADNGICQGFHTNNGLSFGFEAQWYTYRKKQQMTVPGTSAGSGDGGSGSGFGGSTSININFFP